MLEFIGISLMLSVIFVFPLAVITAGLLAASVARNWFQLQRDRLALEREALAHNIELQRRRAELPPWLDASDPLEISAWRSAVNETYSLGMRRRAAEVN